MIIVLGETDVPPGLQYDPIVQEQAKAVYKKYIKDILNV